MMRLAASKRGSRTAYLDGLRGFAAFLVYWQHHQLWPIRSVPANRIFESGWGFEGQYYFASLPIIRTFFTGGHFSVALFFVISGYVLSAKSLNLIYSNEFGKLGETLSSALFRRWIRLHLPILMVTFAYMTSWHLFGIWTVSPEHKSSWWQEAKNWYSEFRNYSFVFRTGGEAWFTYNFPTWSIPVEFRGSIIVYTAVMAFSRATRNARLWCEVGLIFYFLYIADGWFGAMFMAGMLLCELDILARNDNLPRFIKRLEKYKKSIYYSMFFVGLMLSGVPSHLREPEALTEVPGWRHLYWMKPQAVFDQKWFFLFWAAVLIIPAIPRIWWLKAFFETSFNQYLGRISFALYLIHGPILWTIGDRIYVAVGWYRQEHEAHIPGWINRFPLTTAGPVGLEPRFLVPHLFLLPFTLWASEMVTRFCDETSVRFSQWLYDITLPPSKNTLELHGYSGVNQVE